MQYRSNWLPSEPRRAIARRERSPDWSKKPIHFGVGRASETEYFSEIHASENPVLSREIALTEKQTQLQTAALY